MNLAASSSERWSFSEIYSNSSPPLTLENDQFEQSVFLTVFSITNHKLIQSKILQLENEYDLVICFEDIMQRDDVGVI